MYGTIILMLFYALTRDKVNFKFEKIKRLKINARLNWKENKDIKAVFP